MSKKAPVCMTEEFWINTQLSLLSLREKIDEILKGKGLA